MRRVQGSGGHSSLPSFASRTRWPHGRRSRMPRSSGLTAARWAPEPLRIRTLHGCRPSRRQRGLSSESWTTATQRLRVALGSNPGPLADAQARLVAARLATLQGRQSEAESHLERADELFQDGSAFLALEFDAVRTEVRLGAHDWIGAHRSAMTGLTTPVAPVMCEWLLPLAARALADRIAAARDVGDEAVETRQAVEELAATFPHIRRDVGPDVEKWRTPDRGPGEALSSGTLSSARRRS